MAIFQRDYQGLKQGLHTVAFRSHILQQPWVILRYALEDIFSSRIFSIFFVLSFIPALASMCAIYMSYNLEMLTLFKIPLEKLIVIDTNFFARWMQMPMMSMVFVMMMWVGPVLISPDISHNALSLYLSRPMSKAGYIFGKLLVLLILGSLMSWVPGLLLIVFHASLSNQPWLFGNLHIPIAFVISAMIWIVSLSVLSLAISAWVKWKTVARLSFFGLIWLSSALGSVVQYIFGGWAGTAMSLFDSLNVMMSQLYGIKSNFTMPAQASIIIFASVTILSILLLSRKVRAYEVVA